MPKAVWTGSLSLGLVNVPVSLYAATEPKDVRFRLVDRAGRRVRYRRFVDVEDGGDDPATARPPAEQHAGIDDTPELGRTGPRGDAEGPPVAAAVDREGHGRPREVEVAYADLMRGFEVDRNRLVTIEPEELERARPEKSHTIDLEHFVRLGDIDPIYFEKSYFLAPRYASHAEKPYVLLRRAMQEAGQVGIGRFVLRTKPHLVAIRAVGDVLALETLYFGDEVRAPREVVSWLEGVEVTTREIEMAKQLIAMLATEWDPAAYADEYREELLRLIAEKVPTEARPELEDVQGSAIEDLMEALKASVKTARKKSKTPKTKPSRAG